MSFEYDKIKQKQESGNSWTSYSDLFMVLSFIFLLLYVVASLRNGAFSVQQHLEYQQLSKKKEDLRRQLKVYNTLRGDYLEHGASEDEQKMYGELMDKLSLLQDQANQEKKLLRQKAQENAEKERALNQYQQMIRNIINTNLLAKARIKRKDVIIEKKKSQIQNLSQEIANKKQQIATNNQQIEKINSALQNKIAEVRKAHSKHKRSKESLQEAISKLKSDSQQEIKKLQLENKIASSQLSQANQKLDYASNRLEQAKQKIVQTEKEKSELEGAVQNLKETYSQQMASLQDDFEKKMKKQRADFEKDLKKQKLSAKARAEKEAQYRQKVRRQTNKLKKQLAQLDEKAKKAQGKLQEATQKHDRYLASIQNLKQENQGLSKDLKKAKDLVNARKKIAKSIQENLKKAGLEAQVDGKTGDVILSFKDEYFDTNRASLKPGMKTSLKKLMPAYTDSLFKDKKIAEKIEAVEVVGFASPTFRGKYIDPKSLDPKDRAAVSYNLDLSYERAKSIFDYVFDTQQMKYPHQKKLLPLVKVTGRSFLAEGVKGRNLASGISKEEYCSRFDCKKAQKVIIKFNLKQ